MNGRGDMFGCGGIRHEFKGVLGSLLFLYGKQVAE